MPSSPIIAAGEEVCEELGLDALLDLRSTGITIRQLCFRLAIPVRSLYRYLNRDPERRAAWDALGVQLAEGLVDEARELLDSAPLDRDAITKAKAQAEHRRWEAAFRDPAKWSQQAVGMAVQINFGQLHLDALRQIQAGDRSLGAAPVNR